MTAFDRLRDTLNRLEQAEAPAPRLTVHYHDVTDEQVTAVLEALDTLAWKVAGNTSAGTVWIEGGAPGIQVVLYVKESGNALRESPTLTRARDLLAASVTP